MHDLVYPIAAIGVVALVTWGLRAFPFVLFTCLIALLILRRPIEAKEGREDA